MIENRTFDEIAVGDSAAFAHDDTARYRLVRGHLRRRQSGAYGSGLCAADMFHRSSRMGCGRGPDFQRAWNEIAWTRHDLSRAGSALSASGEYRRYDHCYFDGDGKACQSTAISRSTAAAPIEKGEVVITGTARGTCAERESARPRVELPDVRLTATRDSYAFLPGRLAPSPC